MTFVCISRSFCVFCCYVFLRTVNDDDDVEREQYKLNEMAALGKIKTHFHNEHQKRKKKKGGRDESQQESRVEEEAEATYKKKTT